MKDDKSVSSKIEINATLARVWKIITDPTYAKILGNEFDKNAYVESDWKLGSKVHFKYGHEPDKAVNTGTITRLVEEELIQVDYKFFPSWTYAETYTLRKAHGSTVLQIDAGPYGSDIDAQKIVWQNWLLKVKTLSETDT